VRFQLFLPFYIPANILKANALNDQWADGLLNSHSADGLSDMIRTEKVAQAFREKKQIKVRMMIQALKIDREFGLLQFRFVGVGRK
jgi:hypothetical protein